MENEPIEPLDTGLRIRRKGRKRLIRKWLRRFLRNRSWLLVAFWMVKAIVQLVRLIGRVIDGS